MPSLRIDQSELMCKNGCEFFGNPQWQGYCSKCHSEQQKQKRADKEKSKSSSATLPKPDRRQERGSKLSSHSSFSKFEEKRLKQSETLKKANLLKFSVFKKAASTEEHDHQEKRQEFKIPSAVNEGMKREFRRQHAQLGQQVDRDCRVFVHSLIGDVMKYAHSMPVDELSERVQRHYRKFMKHMETSAHFAHVDADTKERMMDYVETHAMTYLHDLPSVVFSPLGTDDERLDRAMSERIQQLSWVCESHLECQLDRNNKETARLLYTAISELLGVDGQRCPSGKLSSVRSCCRHVLELCSIGAKPASADDLLPALILTVLKANPPRLISNINFVTRFCNAQRLMTGEGGYYFTNLCCAVSFIENMTANSLNMDKEEFDSYMTMPSTIGGSSWAAALSLCAELREVEEQNKSLEELKNQFASIEARANELANSTQTFQQEITKKVEDVLAKTPLEVKPRRQLPRFGKFRHIKSAPLLDLGCHTEEKESPSTEEEIRQNEQNEIKINTVLAEETNVLGLETEQSRDKDPTELLTPITFAYDTRSLDEIMTPDEFAHGLSNINYDIDLSDFSGDNSLAEDVKEKVSDPFSPDLDPFTPKQARDPFSPILETFDQFSLNDSTFEAKFEVDPFSPIPSTSKDTSFDPFSPIRVEKDGQSILDVSDSPTTASLLPSPLQPQSSDK